MPYKDKEKQREASRLWAAEQAVLRLAAGLCRMCVTPIDTEVSPWCAGCIEKRRESRRKSDKLFRALARAAGLCATCRGPNLSKTNRSLCPSCAKRQNTQKAKRRRVLEGERQAKGLCTKCGRKNNNLPSLRCRYCSIRGAMLKRVRRRVNKERSHVQDKDH